MNKFRSISPSLIASAAQSAKEPRPLEGLLSGGMTFLRSPQDMELSQSRDLDQVRVENGALCQDFGVAVMGDDAGSRILALGEHRYIDDNGIEIAKTFRLFAAVDGKVEIEVWNGSAWVEAITGGGTDELTVEDVLLSAKSYFDNMFFADGTSVFRWGVTSQLDDQADDFTAMNALTAEDDEVSAAVVPAAAFQSVYEVRFKAEITGPAATGSSIIVALLHEGVEIDSRTLTVTPSTDTNRVLTYEEEIFDVIRAIVSGDELTLQLKNITIVPVTRTNSTTGGAAGTQGGPPDPNPDYEITKTPTRDVYSGATFTFNLQFDLSEDAEVSMYAYDGATWNLITTFFYSTTGAKSESVGIPAGTEKFGIHVANVNFIDASFSDTISVAWDEGFDTEVHGFVEGEDGTAGVVYQTESSVTNDLALVTEEAAGAEVVARYLGIFANRVIALQSDGVLNRVRWPVFASYTDWLSDSPGAGQRDLDSRSDPIDPLMALEAINSNSAALYRFRSIMRVVQTGQVATPLAFYPWIEGLGTESPFSVAKTSRGHLFFGNDYMVYLLTESGEVPVGEDIQEELIRIVSDLSLVEGVFDPVTQRYLLTVPDGGAAARIGWWFDFDVFTRTQQKVWHRSTQEQMSRPALIRGRTVIFAGPDFDAYQLDEGAVAQNAYWVSPTLNREEDRQADYAIPRVALRYEAEEDTTLDVDASGDGGESWTEGKKAPVTVPATEGKVGRIFQNWQPQVIGADLRIRLTYPTDAKVKIRGYSPEIRMISRRGVYVPVADPDVGSGGVIAWWSMRPSRMVAFQDYGKATAATALGDRVRVHVDSINGFELRQVTEDTLEEDISLAARLIEALPDSGEAADRGLGTQTGAGVMMCDHPDLVGAVSGADHPLTMIVGYTTPFTTTVNREVVGFWGNDGLGAKPRHQMRTQNGLWIVSRQSNSGQLKAVMNSAGDAILPEKNYLRVHRFDGTQASERISGTLAYEEQDLDVGAMTAKKFIVLPSLGPYFEIIIANISMLDADVITKETLFLSEYPIQSWSA